MARMPDAVEVSPREPVRGVLFDLLMAVMDSMAVWSAAAGDRERGRSWRDAVTARVVAYPSYAPYEDLVEAAALAVGLPQCATRELFERWPRMSPWPDASAISRVTLPYGFVTNCSRELATIAARRSGLRPAFVLSAEGAGWYKPDARIYEEACRRLASSPERTLFVAGSTYDGEGAHRAGLRAVLVKRCTDQRLPEAGIPVVGSLEEFVDGIASPPKASGG